MATVTKGRTFVSGETVTPAKLNELVDLATVTGIQTADISDSQVTTAKIADANVTTAKIADANVTTAKIADKACTAAKVDDGAVVQVASSSTSSRNTYSSTIPWDNTVPQNTEGSEVLSQAITPQSATNKVLVSANIFFTPNSNAIYSVALFRGSTCIFANAISQTGQNYPAPLMLQFVDSPATTSSSTYSVRIGGDSGNTFYINGNSSEQKFGATPKSSITIMEIKAS